MSLKIDYQKVMIRMKMDVDYIAEEAYKDGAKDGRNEAWEAARKIVEMPDPPYWEVFDEYKDDLFGKITASEAIEKLKAYEEKQKADEEIKVGDEVRILGTDNNFFIVGYEGDCICGFASGGKTCRVQPVFAQKTGRHINIENILEDMKE